jgi:hypothetical protein
LKDQVAKLSKDITIVQNRDQQYLHEMRRREKDFQQLQTRLQQGFNSTTTKENKLGLELLNPLKPIVKPKWSSRGEYELYQRELASQEVSLREFSSENADLRASLQALFGELQAALQLPSEELNTHSDADAGADDVPSASASLDDELVAKLQVALVNSDFSDVQLALPFEMIQNAAETDFRSRLAVLRDRRLKLQKDVETELATSKAALALAAANQVQSQKDMLIVLVDRVKEYRSIVAEQESILQSMVVATSTSSHSHSAHDALIVESKRLSLEAELAARESAVARANTDIQNERSAQQQSTIDILRKQTEIEVCCFVVNGFIPFSPPCRLTFRICSNNNTTWRLNRCCWSSSEALSVYSLLI